MGPATETREYRPTSNKKIKLQPLEVADMARFSFDMPGNLSIEEQPTMVMPVLVNLASNTGTTDYANQLRTLLRSSGIYALASLASPLVSLVLAPFLTHHLSHEDYGALTIITMAVALLAGLTQLGLASAFFRSYSFDYESSKDRRGVLSTLLCLLLLVSLPVVLAIVLAAPWLAALLLRNAAFSDAVRAGALAMLMQNLTVPGFAWLRAENRAGFFTALSITNLLVNLGMTLVLVSILHMGIVGSLLGTGSGFAVVVLCTLPLILVRAGIRPRVDIARGLLSFGVPNVANLVSVWVLQLSDRYLLSLFGSLAQVASYAVAYNLGGVLSVVVLAPFTLAWPSASYAIAKRDDAPQVFQLVFRWYSIVLLFAAFALSLVSTVVLDLFFPVSYRSAGAIIPIIALSTMFYGLYTIFTLGISIRRKPWFAVVFTTVSALANVALNIVLIPRFGAMGAAISTLLAYVLLAVMAYIVNQRIYPIPFEIGTFSITCMLGLGCYIGSTFLARGQGTYVAWAIFLGTLVLYGVCLLSLGICMTRRSSSRRAGANARYAKKKA
ncbi:MAG: polysaccharide biosynthesis C-terminal domain-containing protein [Chloroflexota bacterium]|nr:polysaccharide biosynthesis C-terminal domain-containing protein [Chloroflexota bacterium]